MPKTVSARATGSISSTHKTRFNGAHTTKFEFDVVNIHIGGEFMNEISWKFIGGGFNFIVA